MNLFLKAALSFRKLGYSVIPIKSKRKTPLVDWKEYQTRKATDKEIKKWWKKWPDANVGIVTVAISGLAVIDCDSEEASQRFLEAYPEVRDTRQRRIT